MVIAYDSCILHSNEKLVHKYSSAKLELLALKGDVTEKLCDYFLGYWFKVLTDNNPLAHVKESKLGAA